MKMMFTSLTPRVLAATAVFVQYSLAQFPYGNHPDQGPLTSFIASEIPLSLKGILDNIGPNGTKVPGAASGLVIASPSKADPNYSYTWTRDSALTLKVLIDTFIAGDASLQPIIQNYISAQAVLQAVVNPSGDLSDGAGLGEPKFNADGTAFTGAWGRPQRDGPALRATALVTYARWLIDNGKRANVTTDIWPILANDLSYVGQYWNQTGFDLWEEVSGSSFFTIAVQHRALVEGNALAGQINQTCPGCVSQTLQVLCFLQSFWNGKYIAANINEDNGRSHIDANTLLGSIHTFDTSAGCDDSTFQPCSSKALANLKVVTDTFRSIYKINAGIQEGHAIAVGRYPEDVYQGGNPWYLCTLAAAEQLYDALYQWKRLGYIRVTPTSLPFFRDLQPHIRVGRYRWRSPTYRFLIQAIRTYADDYVNIVRKYTPPDGALAEQISRDDGHPLSARDLTWSYASLLTATNRRAGKLPTPWGEPTANKPPPQQACLASSAPGTYTPPIPEKPCPTPRAIAITFNVLEPTIYGQNIFLTGSVPALGNSDLAKALPLDASKYTSTKPLWTVRVELPLPLPVGVRGGGGFGYAYFRIETDGKTVTKESGPGRRFVAPPGNTTAPPPPGTCVSRAVVDDVWR